MKRARDWARAGERARLRWASAFWAAAARAGAGASGAAGSGKALLALTALASLALMAGAVFAALALLGRLGPVGDWLPSGVFWREAFERGLGKWLAGAVIVMAGLGLAAGLSVWVWALGLMSKGLGASAARAGERARLSAGQARALDEAEQMERAVGAGSGKNRKAGGRL